MKKILAVLLSAAMALSLCACNGNKEGDDPKNSGSSKNSSKNSGGSAGDSSESDPLPEPIKEIGMWDILPEIPVSSENDFDYSYDSDNGGMVITDYLGSSLEVRIPDTVAGERVVGIDLKKCEKGITELVMPDSVSSFSLSDKIRSELQYLNIPNGFAMGLSFKAYSKLIGLYIGTGMTEIGNDAFGEHKTIKDVYIGKSVTNIARYAFRECASLENVYIPDSVTSIEEYAFIKCESLKSVVVPGYVDKIGIYAFSWCKSLSSVVINSVNEIGSAFCNCTSLESVKINNVNKIGNSAFYMCTSLRDITIPDSVTEIDMWAFQGCASLKSITIPASVTKIGDQVFHGCESLENIEVDEKNLYFSSKDGMLFNKSGRNLLACPAGKTRVSIPDGVTEIGSNAFCPVYVDNNTSSPHGTMESVTIPESVTKIGEGAFRGCDKLTSVIIPDSVTEIGNSAFYECTSLTSVTYKGQTYDYEHIDDLYAAARG